VWVGEGSSPVPKPCIIVLGGRAARGLPSKPRDIGRLKGDDLGHPLGSKSYPQQLWPAELWYVRQVLLAPRLLIGVRHVLNAAVNGAASAIAFMSLLLLGAWLWSVSYGL
jgi:hypothetical protein